MATITDHDPWLRPYQNQINGRIDSFKLKLSEIETTADSLKEFSNGHHYFGFNTGTHQEQAGIWYREWAPEAESLYLIGEFNNWDRQSHPLSRDQYGIWSIFLPDRQGKSAIPHNSPIKVHIKSKLTQQDRIPAYIKQVVQKGDSFTGIYQPLNQYEWQHAQPKKPQNLRIYESHVGMASQKEQIADFNHFTQQILPRIAEQGYNAIQLMAIAQHPLYSSFGYQVSNFFSVSHYFGQPNELKKLIDTAHQLEMSILLDIVHSHSVDNTQEGLHLFDGTDHQYFKPDPQGRHPDWGTKLFNYGKYEVLRFLLSNLRYWQEEYKVDGFRFDGVTSMLYHDHGHRQFNHYDHYFSDNVDQDALIYLQLANQLVHQINPHAITVAEEVSGMPGLARPVSEGGLGFDYRLAMGLPDFWQNMMTVKDEDWNMDHLCNSLINRRHNELHVSYVESHDQALVGDKTIAFWLMDKYMHKYMSIQYHHPVIDRGIALHNMIRLITFALGGEAWLNFMGNEFGHPEWIDFPREGNNQSFKYARRQWNLVDNPDLNYQYLNNFDKQLNELDEEYNLLSPQPRRITYTHDQQKMIAFSVGDLFFIFNFHPNHSYEDYAIDIPKSQDYQIICHTDQAEFGGQNRLESNFIYPQLDSSSIKIYAPCRTAQILLPV